jgi:hypothetical protein
MPAFRAISLAVYNVQDAAVELAKELPPPGQITSRSQLTELGATELVLSNGMRVTSLCSDLSART